MSSTPSSASIPFCAFNILRRISSRVSNLYGPQLPSFMEPFLLRRSLHISGLSLVSTKKSLTSCNGIIHSSPLSIKASMLLSFFTTVHTQHPKRLLPQLGVVVSITRGQSPPVAFLYNVIKFL